MIGATFCSGIGAPEMAAPMIEPPTNEELSEMTGIELSAEEALIARIAYAHGRGLSEARETAAYERGKNDKKAIYEAMRILADMRLLPFYIVDMPLNKDGKGPAEIGKDAASMSYQIWDARTLETVSEHESLSDAVPAWLHALANQEDE